MPTATMGAGHSQRSPGTTLAGCCPESYGESPARDNCLPANCLRARGLLFLDAPSLLSWVKRPGSVRKPRRMLEFLVAVPHPGPNRQQKSGCRGPEQTSLSSAARRRQVPGLGVSW